MNKFEQLVNPILDIRKLIQRLWVILWIILFILVILKFCFGIWYPIIVENKNLLKLFNFIDNHNVIRLILYFVLYAINLNLTILILIVKKKFKNWFIFLGYNLMILFLFIIKYKNNILGSIIELTIPLISIILNLKRRTFERKINNIIFPIVAIILMNFYQILMLFARDLNNVIDTLPSSLAYILQIDYYVFLLIMFIGVNMGILGFGYLWSKETTKLEAIKEKELKKKKPNKKKIEEIDKILAERKTQKC